MTEPKISCSWDTSKNLIQASSCCIIPKEIYSYEKGTNKFILSGKFNGKLYIYTNARNVELYINDEYVNTLNGETKDDTSEFTYEVDINGDEFELKFFSFGKEFKIRPIVCVPKEGSVSNDKNSLFEQLKMAKSDVILYKVFSKLEELENRVKQLESAKQ